MRENKLICVVHAVDEEQAKRNAVVAFDNGAHGIFLINHDVTVRRLQEIYSAVDEVVDKERFIGVNFLGVSPMQAVDLLGKTWGASAIWMDDIGYREGDSQHIDQIDVPMKIKNTLGFNHFGGLLFGGVDFKYKRPALNLAKATRTVATFVDVVTTSGPRTGEPPALEKMQTMRLAVPEKKLAIASGMTPENVDPFLDLVDYFLVATGVSDSHTELNPARVKLMAKKMRR